MAYGVCKLTGRSGQFVKSHLLPKALTRPDVPGEYFISGGSGAPPQKEMDIDIDAGFLAVTQAAKTEGVDLGEVFGPLYRILSKFSHPTALLVRGMPHQVEISRDIQALLTT